MTDKNDVWMSKNYPIINRRLLATKGSGDIVKLLQNKDIDPADKMLLSHKINALLKSENNSDKLIELIQSGSGNGTPEVKDPSKGTEESEGSSKDPYIKPLEPSESSVTESAEESLKEPSVKESEEESSKEPSVKESDEESAKVAVDVTSSAEKSTKPKISLLRLRKKIKAVPADIAKVLIQYERGTPTYQGVNMLDIYNESEVLFKYFRYVCGYGFICGCTTFILNKY